MGDIGEVKRVIWVEPIPDDLSIPDVVPELDPVRKAEPAPEVEKEPAGAGS